MAEKKFFDVDTMTEEEKHDHKVMMQFLHALNDAIELVHKRNAKWWVSLKTGERIERNFGELIALIHSELSEALEGDRKSKNDDYLPHRKSVDVELADALIRIMDCAGGKNIDLASAWYEKMQYNAQRADHTLEARRLADGKKY